MNEPRAPAAPAPASNGLALIVGLSLVWGVSWPAMKIVLTELPVWWFRSICLVFGGLAMLAICALTRTKVRVPASEVRPLLACALFNIVGWHLFSGYGIAMLPAGRSAIIAYSMPIWAALFGWFVLAEPLTREKVTGLVLGVAGLGILMGPDLVAIQAAPIGALCMMGAALTWAYGTVVFKKTQWSTPVAAIMVWQMLLGAVPITLGALAIEGPPHIDLSTRGWIALGFVLAFPVVLGQWTYFKIVRLFPASVAALGTLAVPVIGVLSSAAILGEAVGLREMIALVLICLALASVLIIPALRAGKPTA
jgi:drug/metabolite transporter (DMT)-like permease